MQPSVAVVISFLDPPLGFFGEAIASVLEQDYSNFEVLLVDDGSASEATAFAKDYAARQPHRIRYLAHEGHVNRGLSPSRNLGIRSSQSEYVAFLDADDVWLPTKLRDQVGLLESHADAGMVYGRPRYWRSWKDDRTEDTDFVPALGLQPDNLHRPPGPLTHYLRGRAAVPCPSDVLVSRQALEDCGGFEDCFVGMYAAYEDQAFYAKISTTTSVLAADKCWLFYRLHPTSMMAVSDRLGEQRRTRVFFLRWLERRLAERGIEDRALWEALRKELWMWSAHLLPTGRVRMFNTRRFIKKWMLRAEESIVPHTLRQQYWRGC
jgi:glycosyltransferase involved in cell wall biosynthesis